ncbi:MAG: discoidin domain-containing protein [Verrucomicrobiota bacterium]
MPGNWDIKMLIDGDRSGVFHGDATLDPGFAYSVDLGKDYEITELRLYPRQDGCCPERLSNIHVSIHKADNNGNLGTEIWGTDRFTDGTNAGSTAGSVVTVAPPAPQTGRWIRIVVLSDPVPSYSLQMTELEVLATVPANQVNRALAGKATANGPLFGNGNPASLVDGNRGSLVHGTETVAAGFAYEINLGTTVTLDRIVLVPRIDPCCPERLTNFRVSVHKANGDQIGDAVWSADLHTDGSNPGTEPETLTAALNPGGQFKGQWIRIATLENPVSSYALQLAEVEAYGTPEEGVKLLLSQEPQSPLIGLGGSATFSVGVNVINGTNTLIGYQWQKDGIAVPGATNATYTTPAITAIDASSKFKVVVSYPGLPSITSQEAGLRIDYALGGQATSNRPLYAGWPIAWLIDGDLSNVFHGNTDIAPGFAYEVNLRAPVKIDSIEIYPRQDGCCPERLTNFRVSIHKDNNGQIGDSVWHADLFTDGTNPGSGGGIVVKLTKDLDPTGTFEGQWIRILSLEDPSRNYALQMNEMVVFGTLGAAQSKIVVNSDPADGLGTPGRTATFRAEVGVFNGDPALLTYQWKKNGVDIPGATAINYTTPLLTSADQNAKFSLVASYPGLPSVETKAATLVFDYNYARGGTAYSNRPLYASWPVAWLIDGLRNNVIHGNTDIAPGFAYEVDMGDEVTIDHIDIYPRQDTCCGERLTNFRVSVNRDDAGKIGAQVWSADLFTDGSNPGADPGTVVKLTKDLDPAGEFKGRWVRIQSLEDPVQNYALQLAELEVIGKIQERPIVSVSRAAGGIVLTWTDGALEAADAITGPWTAVSPAVSPYTVTASGGSKFYRLRK